MPPFQDLPKDSEALPWISDLLLLKLNLEGVTGILGQRQAWAFSLCLFWPLKLLAWGTESLSSAGPEVLGELAWACSHLGSRMWLEKSTLHEDCPSDIHNHWLSTGLQIFTFCLPSGGFTFLFSYTSKRPLPLSTNLQPSLLSCYIDKMEAASKDSHHCIHACCHGPAAHSSLLTYLHGQFCLSIQAHDFNTSLPLSLIDYSSSSFLDYSNWSLSMLLFPHLKKKCQ